MFLRRRARLSAKNNLAPKKYFADPAWRLAWSALVALAMLVENAGLVAAAENYRGDDQDSYECSSDFRILNRFSAPAGMKLPHSTKYADVEFTLENNVSSFSANVQVVNVA